MKYCKTVLFSSALAVWLVGSSASAERLQVGWDMLAPPQTAIADPFTDLSTDQLDGLRKILSFEMSKDTASLNITRADVIALREQMANEGLDVDWLFEQRELIIEHRRSQSTAVNPDLIGADIRMPGFILPLEFDGLKTTEFLLVPWAGACIHTPPPPANQMVHVTYEEGVEITGLFDPVWIEGGMDAAFTVQNVTYSDGSGLVEVGYQMAADSVEPYH